MAKAVTILLTIEADWERLERGAPEERACFAALGIGYGGTWLTQAEDAFVNRIRNKVHLSAYQLAQWLAWNWWRLRWEPRRQGQDWALAHRMTTIGGGYVWPNITVFSDGERAVMIAKPTQRCPPEPLRYVADLAAFMHASALERALDQFVEQVRGQLRAEGVAVTNLDRVWDDVLAERSDAEATLRRRFEALLGFDPDEGAKSVLEALVSDAQSLGECAMNEVAADHVQGHPVPTASVLRETARAKGFAASPSSGVRLGRSVQLPLAGQVAAWVRGAGSSERAQATGGPWH